MSRKALTRLFLTAAILSLLPPLILRADNQQYPDTQKTKSSNSNRPDDEEEHHNVGGFALHINLGDLINKSPKTGLKYPLGTTDQPTYVPDKEPPLTKDDDDLVNDLAKAYQKEFGTTPQSCDDARKDASGLEGEGLPLPPQLQKKLEDCGEEPGLPVSSIPKTTSRPSHPGTTEKPPTQPPEEPPIQHDDKPPTIYGHEDLNVPCGILLIRDDDSWIPRSSNVPTTMTAKIYRFQPPEDWVFPGPPRVITFTFVQRSNERGWAMNDHYANKEPDLYFGKDVNPDFEVSDDPTGFGRYFGTAKAKQEAVTKTVKVLSDDYGSFSTLRAVAPPCVPLKQFPNGKVKEVPQPQADKKLPKDDNDNQIADAYEDQQGMHPKATDDDENDPVGNGVAGDGLSAYEEYRGFYIQQHHTRLDWRKKDLFIYDRDHLGVTKYPEATGIVVHLIREDEYDEDRVVNFNRGHANVVKQHGLLLMNDQLEESVVGYTPMSGWSNMGPPKNVEAVKVDKSKFLFRNGTVWDAIHETITHELGHATGIHHHGDPWSDGEYRTFALPGSTLKSSNPIGKAFIWLFGRSDIEEYSKRSICGKALPEKFWVGNKNNRMSGNVQCFMKYRHPYSSIYRAGEGFDCVPDDEPHRSLFCDSPSGTAYNAGGKNAADAAVGNCKGQLIVNDK